jgi:CHRD domain-containing protein
MCVVGDIRKHSGVQPFGGIMHTNNQSLTLRPLAAALSILFFTTGVALAADVKLAGDQEVPPVQTDASASGTITVNADKTVSGSVTTKGVTATAAHIHEGAMGKNGGVIIPLTKNGDTFAVPAGAKLTDAQYAAYQKSELYVNVHSAKNPDGEIRAQLKP